MSVCLVRMGMLAVACWPGLVFRWFEKVADFHIEWCFDRIVWSLNIADFDSSRFDIEVVLHIIFISSSRRTVNKIDDKMIKFKLQKLLQH